MALKKDMKWNVDIETIKDKELAKVEQRLNAARGEIFETHDIAVSGQKRAAAGNSDACGNRVFGDDSNPADGV